jgi:hypothetical protein
MTITPTRNTPTTSTTPLRRRRTAAISVGLATLTALIALTVWLTTTGSSSTVPRSPTVGTHTTTQLPAAPPAQGGHLAP